MEIYNGKKENLQRWYNSLRNFVGENAVYKCGDVLYVSTRNNERYDLIIKADGKSRFIKLYKSATDGSGSEYPKVVEEADGTLRIIINE